MRIIIIVSLFIQCNTNFHSKDNNTSKESSVLLDTLKSKESTILTDDERKSEIAERLVKESLKKQVIIFTHDLVFVSNILVKSENTKNAILCHWIESRDGKPRQVWLNNSPSYEKEYRNAEPAKKILVQDNFKG